LSYYQGIYDFEDFNIQNPTIIEEEATTVVPEQNSEEVKIEQATAVEKKNTEPLVQDTVEIEAKR